MDEHETTVDGGREAATGPVNPGHACCAGAVPAVAPAAPAAPAVPVQDCCGTSATVAPTAADCHAPAPVVAQSACCHAATADAVAVAAAARDRGAAYFCPLCPGVEGDVPGACPKCGMALEAAQPVAGTQDDAELLYMRRRLRVALALSIPLVLLEMSVMAGWLVTTAEDRTIRLWDLRADDPGTDARILRGHDGKVDRLDFSADGRWMISSSSEDNRPRIWDLHADDPTNPTAALVGHEGVITDVAIAGDGKAAYTCSDDMTAKVTTLGLKQINDTVNLESDLIGKYVERLLQDRSQLPKSSPVIDRDYLQRRGLI